MSCRSEMSRESREQRLAERWPTSDQAGEQRIAIVAAERSVVESRDEPSRAFDKRGARGYVPFIFRG